MHRRIVFLVWLAACGDDVELGSTASSSAAGTSSGDETNSNGITTNGSTPADTSAGPSVTDSSATSSSTGPSSSSDASSSGSSSTNADGEDTPIAELEPGELRPGGDTTTDVFGVGAFVQPAANLTLLGNADFQAGLQFAQLDWVTAPGQAEIDGLGPTFNARSCVGCHFANGRGVPGPPDDPGAMVLLRLGSIDGAPDPSYGNQVQNLGISGVPGEGTVTYTEQHVADVVLDDASIALHRHDYSIDELPFGDLAPEIGISPRIPQQIVGMGLLEAIPDADILAAADPDDLDGDGISGRVALLDDGTVGRFGWKSAQATVELQAAAAFWGDLGITSASHPNENCPPPQLQCQAAPSGGDVEITATRMRVTGAYIRLLGVPARRDGDDDEVLRGKTIFAELGCDTCHRPSWTTGDHDDPELADQLVWPYSDLLLHDLGDGLADDTAEGAAFGHEWRTPPLWGLGLTAEIGGGRRLLHDGRAASLAEAILWHDGEAAASRAAYEEQPGIDRERLHAFIESL